jgi:hypothetical protein
MKVKPLPNMWKFTHVSQENSKTSEVTVFMSPDCSWDELLSHFASFLEGAGYAGVVDKLENLGALDLMGLYNKKQDNYDPLGSDE